MTILGIDTGGTFTDFLMYDGKKIVSYKLLSTPEEPSKAIIDGIHYLCKDIKEVSIIHGMTIGTNALLEGKISRTALITTKGFEDIISIGRGNRLDLYDIFIDSKNDLTDSNLRFSVQERIDINGNILTPINKEELNNIIKLIQSDKSIEAIAVCLLFSYKNPIHESIIKSHLSSINLPVSISSDILPEYREYERSSATLLNASLIPIMNEYLSKIKKNITNTKIRIMQSNGGSMAVQKVIEEPIHTILSGPAGGVQGAFQIAKQIGIDKIITVDMGGTSTDISLCNGRINISTNNEINNIPIKIPMINIYTIGAGGGSIAFIDDGGALNVGPLSAGANPGPICYGKGDQVTITDAHLFLGRIVPKYFLGESMPLRHDLIQNYFNDMSKKLNITPLELAEGIIKIVNHKMEQAIRLISIEKGFDTKNFTLLSFGGAGGLHACELMKSLSINKLIIPSNPGLLSALGMILSDISKDYSKSILKELGQLTKDELDNYYDSLIIKINHDFREEGFDEKNIQFEKYLDLRYIGQSYELTIPLTDDYLNDFHSYHKQLYSYSNPKLPTELVNIRVKAIINTIKPPIHPVKEDNLKKTNPIIKYGQMYFNNQWYEIPIYKRELLTPSAEITGPAIIVEYSATTFLPPNFNLKVDHFLNLHILSKNH